MKVLAGEHEITFKFRPQAYYAGSTISLVSSIVLSVVFIAAMILYYRRHKNKEVKAKP